MATKYFRITGYSPKEDFCFIMDSNGLFEKLWQFSALMIEKGFKVLEVSGEDKFQDGNISKAGPDSDRMLLRAAAKGKPESIAYELNGKQYAAVKVGDKIYVPDKYKTGGAL